MKPNKHGLDPLDVWNRLIQLVDLQRDASGAIATSLGLTRQQMSALLSLEPGEAVTMSVLADRCGCQNANLTAIVVDLEERGHVARTVSVHDRRARSVMLTPAGAKLRAKLTERMRSDASPLVRMSRADLGRLDALLRIALREG